MSLDYNIVIPARMASQRLPGKPLISIAGHSLIEHVYRRARESSAQSVVIATDSMKIFDAARVFGADVVMTSADHESGSDRIAECCEQMAWSGDTLVVNLQGDEPLMPPACLDQVAGLLAADGSAEVASLYWPMADMKEAADPNAVKVVVDDSGAALYFSRSLIPYPRNTAAGEDAARWKRHIGLYAYRVRALRAFTTLPPASLESLEKLEQLRFLESGRRIVMAQSCEFIPAGVDTPEDLERVQTLIDTLAESGSR
jgi:3-deoxy-manno-octulosonate cytidylyltransferase (CMP-KDO synthetase)